MQLLPLVEMYCKWDLQEDCSNLGELMRRFDNEAELQSHDLERSMLQMVRDDDVGFHQTLPRLQFAPTSNPFDAIRSSLAAVDTALQGMQPQVHLGLDVPLLHGAHRCSSCHWAAQSACVHFGLCPFKFKAKFNSPAPLLSLQPLHFLPTPHAGMSIQFICAPFLAPVAPYSEPSFPTSLYGFFLQQVNNVMWVDCNDTLATTLPFPPPHCRHSATRPPIFLFDV